MTLNSDGLQQVLSENRSVFSQSCNAAAAPHLGKWDTRRCLRNRRSSRRPRPWYVGHFQSGRRPGPTPRLADGAARSVQSPRPALCVVATPSRLDSLAPPLRRMSHSVTWPNSDSRSGPSYVFSPDTMETGVRAPLCATLDGNTVPAWIDSRLHGFIHQVSYGPLRCLCEP